MSHDHQFLIVLQAAIPLGNQNSLLAFPFSSSNAGQSPPYLSTYQLLIISIGLDLCIRHLPQALLRKKPQQY